jgi:NTP pyrophosphatase (non-canonical NTP hydrolase)
MTRLREAVVEFLRRWDDPETYHRLPAVNRLRAIVDTMQPLAPTGHSYDDCDCVPGHRCDCWDFRAPDGTVAFEPGHFHAIAAEANADAFNAAVASGSPRPVKTASGDAANGTQGGSVKPAAPAPALDVLGLVGLERAHQDAKWGEQNHSSEVWLAILSEEVGEMAKEMLPGGNLGRVKEEAIQVAAVAVDFIEAIDRALAAAYAERVKR